MPTWSYVLFQDAISPSMEQMVFFHDHVMVILTLIMLSILYIMIFMLKAKKFNPLMSEGHLLETIWTLIPSLALIFIAFPSMKVLYMTEDPKNTLTTIKAMGHQWYWSYEYPNSSSETMDVFMEETKNLRLLKCSESIKIPSNTMTQVVVSSADVIHAWTVPTLATKADAVPGRLNQVFIFPKKSGLYSGQCSEICGANHSFMPILIEANPINVFIEQDKQ